MSSLTDIYVRDKWSGRIHRVGDDQHDQLTIWKDGYNCDPREEEYEQRNSE